jgi:hypothetical protein
MIVLTLKREIFTRKKMNKPKTSTVIVSPPHAEKQESDKVFLERTNVRSILNNLLETLNHHQPDEPLHFIYN